MLKYPINITMLSALFIICSCVNSFAYKIEGSISTVNWSWWVNAQYDPDNGLWAISDRQGDAGVVANEIRIVSEYGDTGTVPVSLYLSGDGSYYYDIIGNNCSAHIMYTVDTAEYHLIPNVSEIEIGTWYLAKLWLYDADPSIMDLIVTDPQKPAYLSAAGSGITQFQLLLPEEKQPIPEPSTFLLVIVGLACSAALVGQGYMKKSGD